jgi:hypothetical protein
MSADGVVTRAAIASRRLSRVHAPSAGPLALVALFVLAAALLARWALQVRSFQPDELIYVTEGRGIAAAFPHALWDHQLFRYGIERLNPLLAAVADALLPTPAALTAHKAVNATAFASVSFPVYLLARGLRLRTGFALAAAALAVAVPWATLATSFLNEPVAYPAFAWGLYGCWRAAVRLDWRADLLGLALVALAGLARTNLAVLGAVLVIGVVAGELRFPRDERARGVRAALLRHWPLVVAVGAALAWLAVRGTSSVSGIYPVSIVPDLGRLGGQSHAFLRMLAEGLTIVPVVIGTAWVVRHVVRPLDRERHAYAIVALGATLALVYSLYGGVQEERYMLYLAPLPLLATVLALTRADVSPWAVGAAGLAIGVLIGGEPTRTEVGGYASFAYPAQGWWGHVVVGQIGAYLPDPLGAPPATSMLALLVGAAVAAVALARHPLYGGTAVAAVAVGAQLVVGALATGYALDRYVSVSGDRHGPDFTTRNWIDRAVRPGSYAQIIAENPDGLLQGSGQAAFYNRRFKPEAIDSAALARTVLPGGRFDDWSEPPAYAVDLPQLFRSVGLAGRRVASTSYPGWRMDLVALGRAPRAAWRASGPAPDGWLRGRGRARIQTFGGRCVAVSVAAAPDAPARLTLRSPGGAAVTRRLAPGATVRLTTARPGTAVLSASGRGSVPPARRVSAQVGAIESVRCPAA